MDLKDLLFLTYLDLTVQHHAALVPWYVTCSCQLLLECLQLFPSQMIHTQLWKQMQVFICSTGLEWRSLCWSASASMATVPLYSVLLYCSVGQSGASVCGVLLCCCMLAKNTITSPLECACFTLSLPMMVSPAYPQSALLSWTGFESDVEQDSYLPQSKEQR